MPIHAAAFDTQSLMSRRNLRTTKNYFAKLANLCCSCNEYRSWQEADR